MNSESNVLFELDSSWFIEHYHGFRDDELISEILCDSKEHSKVGFSNIVQEQTKSIRELIFSHRDSIVCLNDICTQLIGWLNYSYNFFLILNDRISRFSFKMDEVNEGIRKLQTKIDCLRTLKINISMFLKELIISPEQIQYIIIGPLDTNYVEMLIKLKAKLSIIKKHNIDGTKIGKEISSVYYSLKSIADHRICGEFSSILGTNSDHIFLYDSELHSKIIKKSGLLKQLDQLGKEYLKLIDVFSNLVVSYLFNHTIGIIESLCGNREEIQIPTSSGKYDRYYFSFHERQLIINKVYLDTEESLEKVVCFLPKENYHIEEVYFLSHRIVYKAFISVYELSRHLFPINAREIMSRTFSFYFDKITDIYRRTILDSNDSVGLSIIFIIFFKYKSLLEAKISVFEHGASDCGVIFKYYTNQGNSIYFSLENSIISHLESLPLLSSWEFMKSYKSDKLSHLHHKVRSLSEFLLMIIRSFREIGCDKNKQIKKLISKIQQSLAMWLKRNSNILQDNPEFEKSCIYIINCVDAIISTFQDDEFSDIFRHMFHEHTQKYAEYRFRKMYVDIHKFLDSKLHTNDFSVQEVIKVMNNFYGCWRQNIDIELQRTLTSFSNFETSEEIMRLIGTTIAMKYSQFTDEIKKNSENRKYIQEKKVNTEEILEYVQKCMYP